MSLYEGWYRPLGELENHSAYLYDNHNYGISYVVRIATSRPTTEEDVRRVFTLLFRKTINLRMVPAERDGQLWLREMKHHQNIDLQTLLDVDVKAVFEEMARYKYNMNNGPVWAVRFLPLSPKHDDYIRLTTMESADNKLITLPHVSHIVMSFHHSITDGYTCVRIIRHVLMLLNDVIEGNPIDESQQYAQMLDITKQNVIFEDIYRTFSENPDLLKARSKRLDTFFPDALLSQVYEHPSKTLPKIVSLPRILDSITTTKFVERCKEEGVTVHSGFCSVLEASVVKALQDAFLMQDRYPIASRHCVDQRRYFNDATNAYGTALGVLTLTTDVPRDICSNFWSHVKKFHQDFVDELNRMNSMELNILMELTGKNPRFFIDSKGIDSPPPKIATYSTSNMRDVTDILSNFVENVDLLFYDQLTAVQALPILWSSNFQSLNGQLMHSLQYNTQLMEEALAVKIVDSAFEILKEVVEQS